MCNAEIKYSSCYNYFVGTSSETAINIFLARCLLGVGRVPLSNDCSQCILEEMCFFHMTRQADQVLKREKNYVTECHGRAVGTPASHLRGPASKCQPKTVKLQPPRIFGNRF